ncbi:MAG: HK97 gp10 family phage protein [Eubacterium sp.]|nr:HK97 gp10 family phage protein [Eubacterium sp.]
MARMGKFSCSDLKKLQKQLESLQAERDILMESCAKELAARLLRKVKKRTPVGVYPENSGKKGGTLRRGWTVGEIEKTNGVYKIEIFNPVEYALYVEKGHRTANHKGWVEGKFMLTISEQEIQNIAPRILEKKIKQKLEAAFK